MPMIPGPPRFRIDPTNRAMAHEAQRRTPASHSSIPRPIRAIGNPALVGAEAVVTCDVPSGYR
jgi:hypothetical protein